MLEGHRFFGWRLLLLGWKPSLIGWRPSLIGCVYAVLEFQRMVCQDVLLVAVTVCLSVQSGSWLKAEVQNHLVSTASLHDRMKLFAMLVASRGNEQIELSFFLSFLRKKKQQVCTNSLNHCPPISIRCPCHNTVSKQHIHKLFLSCLFNLNSICLFL